MVQDVTQTYYVALSSQYYLILLMVTRENVV